MASAENAAVKLPFHGNYHRLQMTNMTRSSCERLANYFELMKRFRSIY